MQLFISPLQLYFSQLWLLFLVVATSVLIATFYLTIANFISCSCNFFLIATFYFTVVITSHKCNFISYSCNFLTFCLNYIAAIVTLYQYEWGKKIYFILYTKYKVFNIKVTWKCCLFNSFSIRWLVLGLGRNVIPAVSHLTSPHPVSSFQSRPLWDLQWSEENSWPRPGTF